MTTIYPVIMCGGSGTRLWPLSIKDKPKQFHSIVTDKSMLQETIMRSSSAHKLDVADPSFVCALSHEMLIREQCKSLGIEPHLIILEPCARNTAPVAAVISLEIAKIDPEGLILLLPADHHIEAPEAFWEAVQKGVESATSGYLATYGIQPTRAETGYGYIQAGEALGDKCVKVKAFVEKPNNETAEHYLKEGGYFWNGGIFLFSPKDMIDAFEAHAPDILKDVQCAISVSKRVNTSVYLDPLAFSKCRSESIDYAIMEAADKVAMVCPVNMGWTDIGSWEAVRDYIQADPDKISTSGNAFSINCSNSLVRSDGPFVAAIGLEDVIIIATQDSILITKGDQSQEVKSVVKMLRDKDRLDLL